MMIEYDYNKSNINRLLSTIEHREPDRVPYLENWIANKPLYEYVLGRKLVYDPDDLRVGLMPESPEDTVEFAQRLGIDAVICNIDWYPGRIWRKAENGTEHYVGGSVKSRADLDNLDPSLPFDDHFRFIERYLKAVNGTGIGLVTTFSSFFDASILGIGMSDAFLLLYDDRPFVEKFMDILLDRQEKIMREVCSRYGSEIAYFMVNDDIADNNGTMINPDMFMEIFPHRMKRLIAPVQDLGKHLLLHTDGRMDKVLPVLYDIGFDAVHPVEPESNDIFALKQQWAGKMTLMGNIPMVLLAYGTVDEIDETVRDYCMRCAPGGGYILASSNSIMEGMPPENFVAMIMAAQKYGRYGALGQDAG